MKHPKDSQREVGGGLACRPRNQVMTYVSSRESAKLHSQDLTIRGFVNFGLNLRIVRRRSASLRFLGAVHSGNTIGPMTHSLAQGEN
jgi:hypothetical protein